MAQLPPIDSNLSESLPNFPSSFLDAQSIIRLSGIQNDEGGMLSVTFWLRFECQEGEVEGKLHLPATNVEKIIIFEPGFPGDGSTRLETLHLRGLLELGYAVFAVRHNGTIINGPYSSNYLNCPERQHLAARLNQEVLGKRLPHTLSNWLTEPLVCVQALAPVYSEIYIMSHSFGGLAALYSISLLAENAFESLEHVKRIVSLSGSTGRLRESNDPILVQWREHLDTDASRARVSIGDPDDNIEILRRAYMHIHDSNIKIPETIDMILITPWGDNLENLDELVSPLQSLDIIASLGRGSLVIDKTQYGNAQTGRMVHDMDNLPTSALVNFLGGNLGSQNKIAVIR